MTVAELSALAARLHLTARQRQFAELLAADPDRNNSAAARSAGCGESGAHVTANRWLKLPRVQEYMAALTAVDAVRADEHTRAAIATRTEIMETLTGHLRARIGDFLDQDGEPDVERVREAAPGVVRRFQVTTTTLEDGQVVTRYALELADGQRAGQMLDDMLPEDGADKDALSSRRSVVIALLADPGKRRTFDQLAEQAHRAVEVVARRVKA